MTTTNTNKELFIIFVYLSLIDILFYLLNHSLITFTFYVVIWTLLQVILITTVFKVKQQATIGYILTFLYLSALVSIYPVRFGLYPGDSQFDLFMVQTIIREHTIPHIPGYCPCKFPALHLLTIYVGTTLGKITPYSVYGIAKVIPVILFFVTVFISSVLLSKLSENLERGINFRPCLQICSILTVFSVPLLIRWIIQYTRTTMSLPLFILTIYSMIYIYHKNIRSGTVLLLIILFSLSIAHPITTTMIGVIIGAILVHKKTTTLNAVKGYNWIFLVSTSAIVSYWIYLGGMMYPIENIAREVIYSIKNPFKTSLVTYVMKIIFNKSNITQYSSEAIPHTSPIIMYLGIFRVILITGIILLGVIWLYYQIFLKKIDNKGVLAMYSLASMTILAVISISYLFGSYSITYARVIIYILLIGNFSIYFILSKTKSKTALKNAALVMICATIILAPYYYDQTTTFSKWLFYQDPHRGVDYNHCQVQRFLDYYQIQIPKWIGKYTPKDSLIWTPDAIHIYSSILGFGNRYATYIKEPINNKNINIDILKSYGVNYAVLTHLDKKCIILPYSGEFKQVQFSQVYYSSISQIIFSTQDNMIIYIPSRQVRGIRHLTIKGMIQGR